MGSHWARAAANLRRGLNPPKNPPKPPFSLTRGTPISVAIAFKKAADNEYSHYRARCGYDLGTGRDGVLSSRIGYQVTTVARPVSNSPGIAVWQRAAGRIVPIFPLGDREMTIAA